MEEKTLNSKELTELKDQYFTLSETIKEYRKGMMSRKFRDFTPQLQSQTKMQYAFFKSALRDTVRLLIDHNAAGHDLLSHAVWNRGLPLKTRWTALKELWKKSKSEQI